MILTTVCLAVSASAVKVQVKTEDVLDDIGDWFEGVADELGDWWHYEFLDEDRGCKATLHGNKLGEVIPDRGYTSTYEMNRKLLLMTGDLHYGNINREYYSVFG